MLIDEAERPGASLADRHERLDGRSRWRPAVTLLDLVDYQTIRTPGRRARRWSRRWRGDRAVPRPARRQPARSAADGSHRRPEPGGADDRRPPRTSRRRRRATVEARGAGTGRARGLVERRPRPVPRRPPRRGRARSRSRLPALPPGPPARHPADRPGPPDEPGHRPPARRRRGAIGRDPRPHDARPRARGDPRHGPRARSSGSTASSSRWAGAFSARRTSRPRWPRCATTRSCGSRPRTRSSRRRRRSLARAQGARHGLVRPAPGSGAASSCRSRATPRPTRRSPTTRGRRWTAAGRAATTSTSTRRRPGRATRPRPWRSTRPSPAITSRSPSRRSCRACPRSSGCSARPPSPRAGACTPSGCRTRWACTPPTWTASGSCRSTPGAPGGSSSTPACTRSAGRGEQAIDFLRRPLRARREQHRQRGRPVHRVARPGARLQDRPARDPAAARASPRARLGDRFDIKALPRHRARRRRDQPAGAPRPRRGLDQREPGRLGSVRAARRRPDRGSWSDGRSSRGSAGAPQAWCRAADRTRAAAARVGARR